MRISDWSSDVCSSDLSPTSGSVSTGFPISGMRRSIACARSWRPIRPEDSCSVAARSEMDPSPLAGERRIASSIPNEIDAFTERLFADDTNAICERSEEHTSELQSLMRISYAVFCLKKKNKKYKE